MFSTSKHTYFNYTNNGKYIIGLGSNQEITDDEKLFENYKSPSVYINNFFTGAMLASEILKFFAEDYESMLSINKMVGIHNKTMKLETRDIIKDKKCLCVLNNGEI